jgi:CHASE3 domain sensor protein
MSKTVQVDSRVLWSLLISLLSTLIAVAVVVWHERDSRIEADIAQIQEERNRTLNKYLESKDSQDKLLKALTEKILAD